MDLKALESELGAVINLKDCEYRVATKSIVYRHSHQLSKEWPMPYPPKITVVSPYTNREVVFRPISQFHPKFNQDQWDGEQQVYAHSDLNIKHVELLYVTLH